MRYSRSKRVMAAIWLTMLSGVLMAQSDSLPAFSGGSHHLYLYTSFELSTNSLNNKFLGDLYKGAYLTDDIRQKTSASLKDHNRGGYLLEGGLYYFFAPRNYKKKFGYYLGFEEHEMAELDFHKNFFDLVFFGNEPFSGQKVEFNDMHLNIMAWQQFKAGVFKAWHRPRAMHQVGGAFSFNIGQKNIRIDVEEASLFTQHDGEYVELDANVDFYRTDSNKNGLGSFNGYGPSFDLSYNFSDKNQHEFQFRLSDIGFIRWDRNPDFFTRDTSFRFDGFNVDIFDLESPVFGENIGDSLLNEVIGEKEKKAYRTRLPLDIHLQYDFYFSKRRFSVGVDARHLLFTMYRPRFAWNAAYHLNFKGGGMSFQPLCTYGGYGGWNAGLGISARIKDYLFIALNMSTIDALMFPGTRSGLSAGINIYTKL